MVEGTQLYSFHSLHLQYSSLTHYAKVNNFHGIFVLGISKLQDSTVWDRASHPPHSPDLAPSNHYFFPKMEEVSGQHFDSDVDVTAVVNR